MKTVVAHKKHELVGFARRAAEEADIAQMIEEDTIVIDGDSKEIIALYVALPVDTRAITEALQGIKYQSSDRTGGLKTTSRIFGYTPRSILRADFCSATSLAIEAPQTHNAILQWGKYLAEQYETHLGERYKDHLQQVTNKVKPDYQIKDTPFTSGIINKNNQLKYHHDSGNFKGVYSCMLTLKAETDGGNLAMPEYELGFNLANGSALMFDGQAILHGVTPIVKKSHDAYRYTIVYYSLLQMWKCETLTEEIARIRKLKSQREARRARVMRGLEEEHPTVIATQRAGIKRTEAGK